MSANPRMTVRVSPSTLHQLAYLAARHKALPAEWARTVLTAACQKEIAERGYQDDWQRSYWAWLDTLDADAPTPERPTQRDYDGLAEHGVRVTKEAPRSPIAAAAGDEFLPTIGKTIPMATRKSARQ